MEINLKKEKERISEKVRLYSNYIGDCEDEFDLVEDLVELKRFIDGELKKIRLKIKVRNL